ncbi:NB-ARC domain-containing protein/LRR_8 domain-containing protein [Cephalotus follicularis]|uniref:NB-ARC domain-containing protein/LRR_8 domain-containing protein n=1 Tax=Cephalotus follicularis TaxID=3775 RepID=A0A1Q3BD89_CEPFO|nr:NB-ARC domain-containing protein/LRR_8 domain-containing protein [Cephalotus follicularis]
MGNICSVSMPCDAVATRCWDDCIRGRAMYICKLEDNLAALNTALGELQAKREDLTNKVILAEQQHLKRLAEVQLWLTKVVAVENEVNELIRNRPQEIERLCLGGFCSKNCRSSYKFGKRVAQILERVTANLKRGREFKEVAERVPANPGDLRPCDPTVGLESSFERAWSCLQDKKVGVVGIYGAGGVGKTTLLTQLNNKLQNMQNGFDAVIWIVVSQDVKVEKIQDNIGKKIGLFNEMWKRRSHDEKATNILNVLSEKKFVLLLDDIWERINLTEVGIPQPDDQNGSKVLFTTRSEKVCFEMNAKEKIRVECLAWEEAWKLFQEKVGEQTLQFHSDIPKLAETVAKECGGLPLALITIGRSMSGKRTPQQWNYAIEVLQRLQRTASEFSGMEKEVFPILKFSYDNIRSKKVKSCFLYCALFPEDFSIQKEELIEYWIVERFFYGYNRSGAENEGHEIIGFLLNASLLEDGNENNSVKMHDVIRDLALWIANKCGKSVKDHYLVRTGAQLVEAPHVSKWKESTRVSLMNNQIKNLTEAPPECPNLLTLFLRDNELKNITNDFFQCMPSITVLDLSYNLSLKELPVGISKLVSLQYFNLSRTGIVELPIELKNLVRLKYLNLEDMYNLRKIPKEVISSFSKLEIFKIWIYCRSSGVFDEDNVLGRGNELLVEELHGLKYLNTLIIYIGSDIAWKSFQSSNRLQSCTEGFLLHCEEGPHQFKVSWLANTKRLEKLSIIGLKGDWASEEGRERQPVMKHDLHHNSVSVTPSERSFHSLRYVHLSRCSKLRELTRVIILAPNLNRLWVSGCDEMEEIISERKLVYEFPEVLGSFNPFAKLESLRLFGLPQLKSIYPSPLPFPRLTEMHFYGCPKLKKLPLNSNTTTGKDSQFQIEGKEEWFQELEWEDETTRTTFLPCFRPFFKRWVNVSVSVSVVDE